MISKKKIVLQKTKLSWKLEGRSGGNNQAASCPRRLAREKKRKKGEEVAWLPIVPNSPHTV